MGKIINVPDTMRPPKPARPINKTIPKGPVYTPKRRDQDDSVSVSGFVAYQVTEPSNLPHTHHIKAWQARMEFEYKRERERAERADRLAREAQIMERKRDQWRTDALAEPGRVYDALNNETSDRVTLTGNSAIVWDARKRQWVASNYASKPTLRPVVPMKPARKLHWTQAGNRQAGGSR